MENCYGTSADDIGHGISPTLDNGYFITGTTNNRANGYVAKINSTADWSVTIGGNATDEPSTVLATSDRGCLVAGLTNSTNLSGFNGGSDVLLAKIAPSGQVQWIKALGTPGDDRANKLIRTTDGGFALVGYSGSNLLVMKLHQAIESITNQADVEAAMLVQWQQFYPFANNNYNNGYSITEDGGFFYVTGSGYSSITSINTTLYGKVSATDGSPVLLKALTLGEGGGPGFDIIRNKENTGCIIVGRAACSAIVFPISDEGEPRLLRSYGGSGRLDVFSSITLTSDGYLIAGKTNSKSGDITGAKGGVDMWLFRIGLDGSKISSYNLGGTKDEEGNEIIGIANNEFMVIGSAQSTSGDVSGNKGRFDIWAVKVKLP
jgi:hypothetical protein